MKRQRGGSLEVINAHGYGIKRRYSTQNNANRRGTFVYLVKQDGNDYVLKEGPRAKTLEEIEVSRRASDAGVGPTIIETFEDVPGGPSAYFVLQNLTGPTIKQYLQSELDAYSELSGEPSPEQKSEVLWDAIKPYMITLCDTINKLHNAKILHDDLHDRNIMFTKPEGQRLKIIDFGTSTYKPEGLSYSDRLSDYQFLKGSLQSSFQLPDDSEFVKKFVSGYMRELEKYKPSSIIKFSTFNDFLEENRAKIRIPPVDHSPDPSAFREWIGRIAALNIAGNIDDDKKNTYLMFAHILQRHLTYVSFEEYYTRLGVLADDILAQRAAGGPGGAYDEVYFVVPDESSKSNTWVMLLLAQHLVEKGINPEGVKIIDDMQGIGKLARENPEKNYLALYVDDMSYSGTQIYSTMIDSDTHPNVDIKLAVAYIGTSAVEKIGTRVTTDFVFPDTIIKQNIGELIQEDIDNPQTSAADRALLSNLQFMCSIEEGNRSQYVLGRSAFRCNSNLIPIYFDHKLADALSTFPSVLRFGTYPYTENDSLERCELQPLIRGCAIPADMSNRNRRTWCTSPPTGIPDEIACPPTFYKGITYTSMGQPIAANESAIEHIANALKTRRATMNSMLASGAHAWAGGTRRKVRRRKVTRKRKLRSKRL